MSEQQRTTHGYGFKKVFEVWDAQRSDWEPVGRTEWQMAAKDKRVRAEDMLMTTTYFDGERRNVAPTLYITQGSDKARVQYMPGTQLMNGMRATLSNDLWVNVPTSPGFDYFHVDDQRVLSPRDLELLAWMASEIGLQYVEC